MNEDMQQQFVSWLAQKLGAKDEQDLKSKMQQMGNEGIKQAYNSFMQEQQQSSQGVPQQMQGGKLDYLRCLQAYKKGGKVAMSDCGCNTKEMKSGGRVDKNENQTTKDYMKQRKDGANTMLSEKADKREDRNKQDKNPGKKDWMSKGRKKEWTTATGRKTGTSNNAKEWTTAVTKVPKGQAGMMATPTKKMSKKQQAMSGTMGG